MTPRLVRCTVSARWSNLDPQNPPSDECKAAVQTAVQLEVPRQIRDDWAASAITVAEDGSLPTDALMAYAHGKVEALNAVRLAANPEAAEFAVTGEMPETCHYYWVDENRVCYYTFGLSLGGAPWVVKDPTQTTADPRLELGLEWGMHTTS